LDKTQYKPKLTGNGFLFLVIFMDNFGKSWLLYPTISYPENGFIQWVMQVG